MSLKERREIVALAQLSTTGVLVSLVRAAGSSYRRPGARLLALPDGRTAGTISGGCLEADLLRRAGWRVRDGAVLQTYDTGFDDTAEIPFGLGCGGLVDLLLEPLESPEAMALLDALNETLAGAPRRIVTHLPGAAAPLTRVVLDDHGDVLFASDGLSTDRIVDLRRIAQGRAPAEPDLFVEELAPAQRLVLFGAGEDARPLTRVAAELGWTIVVADGRPQQAKPERFPQADTVLVAETAGDASVTADDAVVLMTHSFEQDRRLLAELLPLSPRYLGLLGARQRSALLLREAAEAAGLSFETAVERTHAPIGLELGGDGPESIALAITAEIQTVLEDARGTARRMSAADATILLERFGPVAPNRPRCALDAGIMPPPAAAVSPSPAPRDISR